MAKNANPRKNFNFSIQVVGESFDPFLVQKIDIPEREIEVVTHGETNHDIKTGGRVSFGNLVLEKIFTTTPNLDAHTYFEDWMASVQDPVLGGGLSPLNKVVSAQFGYKRDLIIFEFPESGVAVNQDTGAPTGVPLNTWYIRGAWPSKRDAISLNRTESENTIERIELSVDYIEKI
jgi:phage tail-like protein